MMVDFSNLPKRYAEIFKKETYLSTAKQITEARMIAEFRQMGHVATKPEDDVKYWEWPRNTKDCVAAEGMTNPSTEMDFSNG